MEVNRKAYQGVRNIVRFNRHYYLWALLVAAASGSVCKYGSAPWALVGCVVMMLTLAAVVWSLMVSYIIFDASALYELQWLEHWRGERMLHVSAGFDETSAIIQRHFRNEREILCADFYNPKHHTEASIKYAQHTGDNREHVIRISTKHIPLPAESVDAVVAFMCLHEVRDEGERIDFLNELHRVLRVDGQLYVVEHLRDVPNFIAFNIAFVHFFARRTWLHNFHHAGWLVKKEQKLNAFVRLFILEKNGTTS